MANDTTEAVDTHDPAGYAAFLRERAKANREIASLPTSQWPHRPDVMRHWALRFEQGAELVERLARRVESSGLQALQADMERDSMLETLADARQILADWMNADERFDMNAWVLRVIEFLKEPVRSHDVGASPCNHDLQSPLKTLKAVVGDPDFNGFACTVCNKRWGFPIDVRACRCSDSDPYKCSGRNLSAGDPCFCSCHGGFEHAQGE